LKKATKKSVSKPSSFSRFNQYKVASTESGPSVSSQEVGSVEPKQGRTWTPSTQQQAIFDVVAGSKDNLVVQAGPGCGKTTTAVEAIRPLAGKQKVIMLAFNKAIADELQERVPYGVEARTLHSLGLASLRQAVKSVKIAKEKVESAIEELYPKKDFEKLPTEDWRSHNNRYYALVSTLKKIVSLTKNYGQRNVDLDFVADIIGNYGMTVMPTEELTQQVNALLDNSFNCVNVIDFDDMMWIPMVHNMRLPKYDLVVVDESQDLNVLRQQYSLRVADRLMVIGDERQSIFGFNGADIKSMDTMTEHLRQRGTTQILPLSVTRRCPKSHVALVDTIYPGVLQAAPEAPEGTIGKSDIANLHSTIGPKDFVLCRTNAPLVWAAFRMVKAKRPVVLLGRDFGEGLKHLVRNCAADTQKEYFRNLDAWYHEQLTKFDGPSPKLERIRCMIQDKYDSILAVSEGCNNSGEALTAISTLFSDEAKADAPTLSTIHKAKGLEAERVFLLRPDLLPHPMAKQGWEVQQERNLEWVAKSRSKSHFEEVHGDHKKVRV
jgi:DNA helicase-2/ATP-dependent DNA helicase PcrA